MLVARKRERSLAERFSVLCVCSKEDRAYLSLSCPVHVIPNGFAADQSGVSRFNSPRSALFPPRIGFIGTFDYQPNCDGVRWFLRSCWADLKREIPSLQLRLIGRNPDKIDTRPPHDVYTCGYLDQPDEEMASWSVLIVPLQIGAGSRVKVADGFSRKIPIVATEVGAFGYAVSSGQELLIANSSNDFVNACKLLIRNSEFAAQLAEKAYIRFLKEWSWEAIKPRVWNAAEDCFRISTGDLKWAHAERSTT
jgi:glycosyltransferase involved in cell wall biosynthesis